MSLPMKSQVDELGRILQERGTQWQRAEQDDSLGKLLTVKLMGGEDAPEKVAAAIESLCFESDNALVHQLMGNIAARCHRNLPGI
jgi:hypothetical protein